MAAAFIVVFHFGDEAPIALRSLHPFFSRGYLATDFFLLLSGFILSRAYGPSLLSGRVSPAEFMVRRLIRNYPAHVITLAGLVAMVLTGEAVGHRLSHPDNYAWSAIPAQLLMAHGWGFAAGTWNGPTWTISALLVCYAAFPLTWPLLQRLRRPPVLLALALAVAVGAEATAWTLLHASDFSLPFKWGLGRAIPLFLIGQLLARYVETARLRAGLADAMAALGAVGFLANAIWSGPDLVGVILIGALIVGCGASPPRRRWPGATWAADVSFSLFFTQTLAAAAYADLVRKALVARGSGPAVGWGVWALGLAFTLGLAALFHHLVDQPIQARLRTLLASWKSRRVPRPALAQSG